MSVTSACCWWHAVVLCDFFLEGAVHALRHMQSHVHMHMQNPLNEREIAHATSLSTVQSHMPNRGFVVATAVLVTVPFCFHNSALSFFILNETFGMLQQQETLYFRYQILDRKCYSKYLRAIALADKGKCANWRSCTHFFWAWTGGVKQRCTDRKWWSCEVTEEV